MLIRGGAREIREHPFGVEQRLSSTNPPKTEDQAAVKIQATWRGRRGRKDFENRRKRRQRKKPHGYYTHTLGLTYVSIVSSSSSTVSHRRRLFLLLEEPSSSQSAQALSMIIASTIVLSIGCFIFETMPGVYYSSPSAWLTAEVFFSIVFTVEYCSRLSVCDQVHREPTGRFIESVVHFMLTPMNVFDLMAVLPFYIEVLLRIAGLENSALRMFRLFRLIRMVRIFKLGRYASGMRLMGEALQNSSQAISVLVFMLCMGVVLFSSALYYVERLSCPNREELADAELRKYADECGDDYNRGVSPIYGLCCTEDSAPQDFPSIIAASWWSMVTMTSVGYGEVYPKTVLGKCVGCFAMLVGMVLIALPVAIVGQKFQDVYEANSLEEAKHRATNRMKVSGEVWSLVPASNVLQRTRRLNIKDPALASTVAALASCLEEVWEQREQLGRERKLEIERQDQIQERSSKLLMGMMPSMGRVFA